MKFPALIEYVALVGFAFLLSETVVVDAHLSKVNRKAIKGTRMARSFEILDDQNEVKQFERSLKAVRPGDDGAATDSTVEETATDDDDDDDEDDAVAGGKAKGGKPGKDAAAKGSQSTVVESGSYGDDGVVDGSGSDGADAPSNAPTASMYPSVAPVPTTSQYPSQQPSIKDNVGVSTANTPRDVNAITGTKQDLASSAGAGVSKIVSMLSCVVVAILCVKLH